MKKIKSDWRLAIFLYSASDRLSPEYKHGLPMTSDIEYMQQALSLAKMGRLTVSPNPMVGCVIVKNNQVIATGFHEHAGEEHAEIVALKKLSLTESKDATVYVTLEPCCHYGRTPPCVTALIRAQVKKVVVACLDPNPLVAGNGIKALEDAGISVEYGICETEAKQLNEIFFHYIQTKRPFVIAKWAMSLDGKTVTHPNDDANISSFISRQDSHRIRQQVDAIIIGAQTAINDDPQLTVRLTSQMVAKQPVRIIVSSRGELPKQLKLFHCELAKTIVATTNIISASQKKILQEKNIDVLILPQDKQGKVHLPSLLSELGKKEITSVLVEGGMRLHQSFFQENLINKIQVYLAPVIIGSLPQKIMVKDFNFSALDNDISITAIP